MLGGVLVGYELLQGAESRRKGRNHNPQMIEDSEGN